MIGLGTIINTAAVIAGGLIGIVSASDTTKIVFVSSINVFANVYAKECGFDRTYIPSEHVGLYEKYGYHYLKDIVNYGNGIDRLYVKQLD